MVILIHIVLGELFAQWSAFIQDKPYDQHELMIHQGVNINTSNAHGHFHNIII